MSEKRDSFLQKGLCQSAIVGFFCNQRNEKDTESNRLLTVRRSCLLLREHSVLFRLFRRLGAFLLRGTVGSYGSFLLLSSVFCILGRLALGRLSSFLLDLPFCFALLLASVLLLHSGQSLSYAIGNSFFGNAFLFSFCKIPRDRLVFGAELGEERWWLTLLAAFLFGIVEALSSPILFYLAIIAVVLWILFQSTPELMLLSLLFFFPFLSCFSHPSAILCISLMLGNAFWFGKAICGHREYQIAPLDRLIALLAGVYLFGGCFGAGGGSGFWYGMLLATFVISYFSAVSFFSNALWRNRGIFALAFSAFICSLIGIWQYFFTNMELLWVDVSRFSDIGGRVTSLFSNPNILAVYLLLNVPISLHQAFDANNSPRKRVLFGVITGSELLCLLLTWSRGAWLGVMTELAVFFLLYGKESRRAFLISLIPIAIWLPFFPHSVVNRFSSIATVTESSISYRLYTWQSTLRLLWAHPFGIGIGEDSFSAVYRNFAISGTETVMHAHNLFLQIAIELGVGGLLCLLAILLFFLQTVCRVFFHSERTMPLGVILGGFCAILGALVMGMFDYIWYQYGLLWLFWVMVALTVGAIREVDEKQARGVDLIL